LLFLPAFPGSLAAQPGERAQVIEIPAGEFNFVPKPAPNAGAIRINQSGNDLSFQQNASTPGNCFGFAETELRNIPEGTGREADQIVIVVDFSYAPQAAPVPMPTFRARINEKASDGRFLTAVTSAMPEDALRDFGGQGSLRMSFDRNRLGNNEDLVLSLDFYHFSGPDPNHNPNFNFLVEDVGYYLTSGDAHSTAEISSAYINSSEDLVMNIRDGRDGIVLRGSMDRYAYDGQYLVGLDISETSPPILKSGKQAGPEGALYGYTANSYSVPSGQEIPIATEGFDVAGMARRCSCFTRISPTN